MTCLGCLCDWSLLSSTVQSGFVVCYPWCVFQYTHPQCSRKAWECHTLLIEYCLHRTAVPFGWCLCKFHHNTYLHPIPTLPAYLPATLLTIHLASPTQPTLLALNIPIIPILHYPVPSQPKWQPFWYFSLICCTAYIDSQREFISHFLLYLLFLFKYCTQ